MVDPPVVTIIDVGPNGFGILSLFSQARPRVCMSATVGGGLCALETVDAHDATRTWSSRAVGPASV